MEISKMLNEINHFLKADEWAGLIALLTIAVYVLSALGLREKHILIFSILCVVVTAISSAFLMLSNCVYAIYQFGPNYSILSIVETFLEWSVTIGGIIGGTVSSFFFIPALKKNASADRLFERALIGCAVSICFESALFLYLNGADYIANLPSFALILRVVAPIIVSMFVSFVVVGLAGLLLLLLAFLFIDWIYS